MSASSPDERMIPGRYVPSTDRTRKQLSRDVEYPLIGLIPDPLPLAEFVGLEWAETVSVVPTSWRGQMHYRLLFEREHIVTAKRWVWNGVPNEYGRFLDDLDGYVQDGKPEHVVVMARDDVHAVCICLNQVQLSALCDEMWRLVPAVH